jgi:Na+-transporting NADH:ubiquinone oxidoreductase subunit B
MWYGAIPGSIGETSKPLIIIGALMLIFMRLGSWRIMLSMVLGCAFTGILFNAWGFNTYMNVPWIYHFYMGSFLFAMAFMATDPVTASATNKGKWIYGFFIGMLGMIVRVMNPAYPEGWMLAILFMNAMAPLIDYFIYQSNISKRLSRA